MKKADEQLKVIFSGTEEVIPKDELKEKIKHSIIEKRPLRIKLGLDPSAPDIHLGHTVVLRKLRAFQDLGHLAVLIVGDFTGTIGDPSGREVMRKQLSESQVRENAKTYVEQLMKILDKKRCEVVYNGDWLKKLDMREVLRLASSYTVARMLERDDFTLRYKEGKPISILEFMYPLLQGYDSVQVKADVEVGGTDQKFNLLVGREIQRQYGQEPQVVITTPLLEGTDGVQKMSKSLSNYIGITESSEEIFGKVMSIPDNLIVRYFKLVTTVEGSEIDMIERGLKKGTLHPGETKRRLGREIVQLYYDKKAAEQAEEIFNIKHKPGYSDEAGRTEVAQKVIIEELESTGEVNIWAVDLVRKAGFAKTNGEARRLIKQGAVRLNGELVISDSVDLSIKEGDLIQVGRRRIAQVKR